MPMKPGSTKNLLLRLDPELAGRLQTVADVEGRPVSDVVREAIAALVERRAATSGSCGCWRRPTPATGRHSICSGTTSRDRAGGR